MFDIVIQTALQFAAHGQIYIKAMLFQEEACPKINDKP